MKLYLDPGHGGSDSGASGNGLREKDITLDIALKIRSILNNDYENVDVRMSRTNDSTVSLSERTNDANNWGADYFLSIHCNAFNGSAQGYEDYIHSSLSDSSQTAQYQDTMHAEIIKVNELNNRGKKKANFHVLRETVMPALLTENGFIDNDHDANLIGNSSWRMNVAQGHVKGLEKAFGLQRKTGGRNGTLYKVIAGSFQSRENADKRVDLLDSKGIDAFIVPTTISGQQWYRVQAGAFSERVNAENVVNEIEDNGIEDVYILTENPVSANGATSGYSITGKTFLSPEHMNQFVKDFNEDALKLGIYYSIFGEYYGIRGDIAFAQAMHETDYLRFTGIVQPDQNNFAGIGATGPDNPGASFATPKEGVLAHLQHLFAYASTDALPDEYPLVDPRFDLVTRGSAPNWTDLNGKWAVPGDNYGQSILNIYERMIHSSIENLEQLIQTIKE